MPYQTNSELPDAVKKLPEEKQSRWREAFNVAVYDEKKSEDEAARIAWAAVNDDRSNMASMVSRVRAAGDKGESDVTVLFDTGATLSFVLRSVAEKIATIIKLPKPYKIVIGDGSDFSVSEMAVLAIKAAGQTIMDTFLVIEKSVEEVILGEATMRKFGLKIDLEHGTIFSEMKVGATNESPAQKPTDKVGAIHESPVQKEKTMNEWVKKLFAVLGIALNRENLTEEQAAELLKQKFATRISSPAPKPVASPAICAALQLDPGETEDAAIAAIMVLQQQREAHPADRFEALSESLRESEILAIVDTACRQGAGEMEGKLYPRQKKWGLEQAHNNLDAFKIFVAKSPKVLAVFDKLPGANRDPARIDATQEAINKQMGVSKETFVKYNTAH